MLRPGFEPGSPARKSIPLNYSELRVEYRRWIYSRINPKTAGDYVNYLDRYVKNIVITSPQEINHILLSIEKEGVRRWVVKALRSFLNFLEEVYGFDDIELNAYRKVLKITRSGVRHVFVSDEEIVEAHEHVNDRFKKVFELIVFSGIRLKQAIEMLRNFNPNNLNIIEPKGIARYPIIETSKGTKKGFFAYMPLEFAKQLEKMKLKYKQTRDAITYKRVSANSIRKWHYNFMISNGIPPDIADFIQGRAAKSVVLCIILHQQGKQMSFTLKLLTNSLLEVKNDKGRMHDLHLERHSNNSNSGIHLYIYFILSSTPS
ncbi:integrase [Archaeoglobales archaeon]|nr:MAG: integrase [Archaeoglobales archaeon]RLI78214.1 MAG: integrase [Archaeoglobales archaeon]